MKKLIEKQIKQSEFENVDTISIKMKITISARNWNRRRKRNTIHEI